MRHAFALLLLMVGCATSLPPSTTAQDAALAKGPAIEMASALVAERQDGTRIFLRYFPTGEIQQWSQVQSGWVTLGFCAPRGAESHARTPRCSDEPLRLLREQAPGMPH